VALHLFTKLQQRSTLIFLQTYPTPQAAKEATVGQIEETLRKGHHTSPTTVAPKIYEVLHQPHLTADEMTTRTKARLMLALVAQLLPLLEQVAAYDKEISERFLTHADSQIFESLPGAGKRLAPRL
jgi:transposase